MKSSSGGSSRTSALVGAAFLMATSAIGPGFLTQTAVFTQQYRSSLACMILLSLLVSLAAQINVWRIIGASGLRGQELANRVFPGLGFFLAFLVVLGGLVFNIGNLAGAGLGLNVLFGADTRSGAAVSAAIAVGVFCFREAGRAMDWLTKLLGILMLLLVAFVAARTRPPIVAAAVSAVWPAHFDFLPAVTLIGGTVGGYIIFAGGHRLIDAGITGAGRVAEIDKSATTGILIAGAMRVLLFLAILGVVNRGTVLDSANPPASAFQAGAGLLGYRLFGIVLWSAAITSVVGSAYTSVSFLQSLVKGARSHFPFFVIGFIAISAVAFVSIGRPVTLLVLAGSLNGLILPLTLGTLLVSASRQPVAPGYTHPRWLAFAGYLAAVFAALAGYSSLRGIAELWQ